jgi:hypothetical protein
LVNADTGEKSFLAAAMCLSIRDAVEQAIRTLAKRPCAVS